jgi:hypothetical protein
MAGACLYLSYLLMRSFAACTSVICWWGVLLTFLSGLDLTSIFMTPAFGVAGFTSMSHSAQLAFEFFTLSCSALACPLPINEETLACDELGSAFQKKGCPSPFRKVTLSPDSLVGWKYHWGSQRKTPEVVRAGKLVDMWIFNHHYGKQYCSRFFMVLSETYSPHSYWGLPSRGWERRILVDVTWALH